MIQFKNEEAVWLHYLKTFLTLINCQTLAYFKSNAGIIHIKVRHVLHIISAVKQLKSHEVEMYRYE